MKTYTNYLPLINVLYFFCVYGELSTAAVTAQYNAVHSVENLLQINKRLNVVMISIPASGHVHSMLAVGEELVRRGHNVTFITGRMSDQPESKLRSMAEKLGIEYIYNHQVATLPITTSRTDFFFRVVGLVQEGMIGMLDFWFQELTQLDKEKWDIMLFNDAMISAAMCIHIQEKIPVIMVGNKLQIPPHTHPSWPWAQPFMGEVPEDLSFLDRLKVALLGVIAPLGYKHFFASSLHRTFDEYCPSASYNDLITGPGTRVPYIVPTAIGFEYSRSFMPLSHYVGPLLSKSPDAIPQDLKQWLKHKEEKSVIYISMGSVITITKATGKTFINGVLQTNYSVIWALRQPEIMEGLEIDTKRVFITKWAPQLSVLQHKAISIAIVHGGFNGIHESLYNGVPLIVVPAFGDQFGNAGRVVNRGLGLSLDSSSITTEKVTSSINEIDSGDYRRNVEHLQKIFILAGGVEMAADLVEYYKEVGFDHLIPAYAKYEWNWIQYYNVDVYGLLTVILVTIIFCSLKCCRFAGKAGLRRLKEKTE